MVGRFSRSVMFAHLSLGIGALFVLRFGGECGMHEERCLEMIGIEKHFPGVHALKQVGFFTGKGGNPWAFG